MVTTKVSRWKTLGLATVLALGLASTSDAQTNIQNETLINNQEITLNRTTATYSDTNAAAKITYSNSRNAADITSINVRKNDFSTTIHSASKNGEQELYLQATAGFSLSKNLNGYAGAGRTLTDKTSHYLYAGANLETMHALIHAGFTHFSTPENTHMNFQHVGVDTKNTYHALANNNQQLVAVNTVKTDDNQHGLINLTTYDPKTKTIFSKTQTGHKDISARFTGEVGRQIVNQFQGPFHPAYISDVAANGDVSSALTITNARGSLDATAKLGMRNVLGPISAVAGVRYNQDNGVDGVPLTLQIAQQTENLKGFLELKHDPVAKNTGIYLNVRYQM